MTELELKATTVDLLENCSFIDFVIEFGEYCKYCAMRNNELNEEFKKAFEDIREEVSDISEVMDAASAISRLQHKVLEEGYLMLVGVKGFEY